MRISRNKRILIGVIFVTVAAIYILDVVLSIPQRLEKEHIVAALHKLSHDRVQEAVHTFKRERKVSGDQVRLRDLIDGGFLSTADVQGLDQRDVIISLNSDETSPQAVWIRVSSTAGDIVELADGSVQSLARGQ